jgi:hypothetical protein
LRRARDRRLDAKPVRVAFALAERDPIIHATEQRAGQAIRVMHDEGLTMQQTVEWCGGQPRSGCGPAAFLLSLRRT